MNKTGFHQVLHNPSLPDLDATKGLEELLAHYPYCQTLHLLYVKQLHLQEDIRYQEQVKLAAAHLTNRKKLYQLVMQPAVQAVIDETEPTTVETVVVSAPVEPTPPAPQVDITPEPVEAAVAEASPEVVEEPTAVAEAPAAEPEITETPVEQEVAPVEAIASEEVIPEAKEPEAIAEETAPEPVIEPEPAPPPPDFSLLTTEKEEPEVDEAPAVAETSAATTAVSEEPEEEPASEPTVEETPISAVEQEIIREAISASYILEPEAHIEPEQTTDSEPEETVAAPEPATPPNPNERRSMSSWMNWLAGDETATKKVSADTESETPAKAANEPEEAPTNEAANQDTSVKRELIDRFINNRSTPVVPAKAEFFSPTNMARLSLLDNEDFVTETLAKVYAQQGKIEKARKVYEKLALKFPEKSGYFAGLIEKLDESPE